MERSGFGAKVILLVIFCGALSMAGQKTIVDSKAVKPGVDSTITIVTPDETQRIANDNDKRFSDMQKEINALRDDVEALKAQINQ